MGNRWKQHKQDDISVHSYLLLRADTCLPWIFISSREKKEGNNNFQCFVFTVVNCIIFCAKGLVSKILLLLVSEASFHRYNLMESSYVTGNILLKRTVGLMSLLLLVLLPAQDAKPTPMYALAMSNDDTFCEG